jgi:hypothetical protein
MGLVVLVLIVSLFGSVFIAPFHIAGFPWPTAHLLLPEKRVVEAQTVSSPWNRTFGGGLDDGGYSLVEVSTGGFACVGYTMSSGAGVQDVWLVRTAVDGSPQWSQPFGGTAGDWGRSVLEVGIGEFIILGDTNSYGAGSTDFYLLRICASGCLLWNKTHGGFDGDSGRSVIEVTGGGFMLGGYTTSFGAGGYDMWVVRTDADGNHLWNQTYGSIGGDFGMSVLEVSPSGFVIAGYTTSFGEGLGDIWLVRIDVNGNLLWSRTYGGLWYEYGVAMIEVSSGGFAIVGYTESFGAGGWDMWLVRTDADGNHLWNQTYGGVDDDRGFSVVEAVTGGFVLTGYTGSFGAGWQDLWVVRTDADGNHLWNQTYGGSTHDVGRSIVRAGPGGYVILGDTDSFGAGLDDFWLIRVTDGPTFPVFPIDPFLLVLIIVVIVVVVIVVVILRRRRKKPQKRGRKK